MIIDTDKLNAKLDADNAKWKAANPSYEFGNDVYIMNKGLVRRIEALATEKGIM